MNKQKSVEVLYSNDKLAERQIRKTISFTVSSKKKKPRNKPNQGSERPIP